MEMFVVFLLAYVLTAIVWVISVFLYNAFVEGMDIGPLTPFAVKSAFLILAVVLVVLFIPYGIWLSIAVWAVGLMTLFQMDWWETRMLIIVLWLVDIGVLMLVERALTSV